MDFNQRSLRSTSLKVQRRLVLVAVKYSAEISSTALIWALNHVVQTGDCVKLLVVVSPHSSKKSWSFPRFRSDCKAGHGLSFSGTIFDQKEHVTDSCTQMMLGLHQLYDPDKIMVKIRVVSGSQQGTVAAEAQRDPTHWVILDKTMKKEANWCAEKLDCNVVVMKKSGPKVLRLNMSESYDVGTAGLSGQDAFVSHLKMMSDRWNATQVPNVTPVDSPEHSAFTSTDIGTPSSLSSLDPGSSPNLMSEIDRLLKKDSSSFSREIASSNQSDSDRDFENLNASASLSSQQWVSGILSSAHEYPKSTKRCSLDFGEMPNLKMNSFLAQLSEVDVEPEVGAHKERPEVIEKINGREIASLTTKSPADPPPLCSTCQHKAPVFGKPPKQFKFAELEHATNGFSQANFLAEGGYGCVHRGVLPDGQVVAVKQRKMSSTQGDQEFCSEVEVLSYAQHRNVVLLIGYCLEDGRRLLVYEYICNGSLDAHLYGHKQCPPLDWSARQKVAVGAARGLRYLHEECRVGCIVHRDLRPNNILLTHDFEPLVGDFGLARWQPDGNLGVDTRIIGTFGYVAPEYAQSGQVTEKTDVYAFGIILLELVSGRKAVDLSRPRGQQFLLDWARPLLKEIIISNLIDPIIANCHSEKEVLSMLRCASLCIERDPDLRPRMSQVLHMLEGSI